MTVIRQIFLTLVCLIVGSTSLIAQSENSILIRRESTFELKIRNIDISDIIYPGNNFEKIEVLGKPLSSTYNETPADEWWTFKYVGLELIYTNYDGEVELSELVVDSENTQIVLENTPIYVKKSSRELLQSFSGRKDGKIKYERIYESSTLNDKYGLAYSFIQIDLDEDNDLIKRFWFKRKIL